MSRGYMDLPCGCRAYVRPSNDGTPTTRRIYLCERTHCPVARSEGRTPHARVREALDAGIPLTPRDGAWPHPIHGDDPRAVLARIEARP